MTNDQRVALEYRILSAIKAGKNTAGELLYLERDFPSAERGRLVDNTLKRLKKRGSIRFNGMFWVRTPKDHD